MPRLGPHDVAFFATIDERRVWRQEQGAREQELWVGLPKASNGCEGRRPPFAWADLVDELL